MNYKQWHPTNFMKRLLHLYIVNNWYLIIWGCFTEVKTNEWVSEWVSKWVSEWVSEWVGDWSAVKCECCPAIWIWWEDHLTVSCNCDYKKVPCAVASWGSVECYFCIYSMSVRAGWTHWMWQNWPALEHFTKQAVSHSCLVTRCSKVSQYGGPALHWTNLCHRLNKSSCPAYDK
jgi:hypothetical protein